MSMNLHLSASIKAVSKIKEHEINESFDLYQTPTKVTREILKSGNPELGYRNWILENFDEDIVFEETRLGGGVQPATTVNASKEHLTKLDNFLKEHEGWDVYWYEM